MNEQRPLPFNPDAERAVIGVCILAPKYVPRMLVRLAASDFYEKKHRAIWSAIECMSKEGLAEKIDSLTLQDWLTRSGNLEDAGGVEYLAGITDCIPSWPNVDYYGKIVKRDAGQRLSIGTAFAIQYSEDPTAALAEGYQRSVDAAPPEETTTEDLADQGIEAMLARGSVIEGGAAFGISDLDNWLGGIAPGTCYVLGGKPSMGKTSLSLHAAWTTASRGNFVVFVTLETAPGRLITQMASQRAGIDLNEFKLPHVSAETKDQLERAGAHFKSAVAPHLLFLHPKSREIADVMQGLESAHAQREVGLVVVDHIQKISDRGVKGETAAVSGAMSDLYHWGQRTRVAMLILSQLRRFGEGREEMGQPRLDDLKQSGTIEQNADVVLFLWGSRLEDSRFWQCAKNRSGETSGARAIHFERKYTRFGGYAAERTVPKEEPKEEQAERKYPQGPDPEEDEIPF